MPENKFYPVIILPPFGSVPIYIADKSSAQTESAWPPSIKAEGLINSLKGSLMASMLFRKDAGLSDALAKIVGKLTASLTVNSDSSFKNPLTVPTFSKPFSQFSDEEKKAVCAKTPAKELAAAAGEENIYFFSYNFLESPVKSSRALSEFVDLVLAQTKREKVNIFCMGLSSDVFQVFADQEANAQKVDRCVFLAPAFGGSPVIADLLSGNYSAAGLMELASASGKVPGGADTLLSSLPEGLADKALKKCAGRIIEDVFRSCLAVVPLLSAQSYETLCRDTLYFDQNSIQTADLLQEISGRFHQTVARLIAGGTRFYCIAGCGVPLIPINGSYSASSDGLVPVTSSAPGITDPGEKNTPVAEEGCMFTSRAWFLPGENRLSLLKNQTALRLVQKILFDDSFDNVNSDPDFPAVLSKSAD